MVKSGMSHVPNGGKIFSSGHSAKDRIILFSAPFKSLAIVLNMTVEEI